MEGIVVFVTVLVRDFRLLVFVAAEPFVPRVSVLQVQEILVAFVVEKMNFALVKENAYLAEVFPGVTSFTSSAQKAAKDSAVLAKDAVCKLVVVVMAYASALTKLVDVT